MPGPALAVAAIVLPMIAQMLSGKQQAATAAGQAASAADQANLAGNAPTLDMQPTFDGGGPSPGAKSAHGRTLESFNEQFTVTGDMPPAVQGVVPDIATAGQASMESPLLPTDTYAEMQGIQDQTAAGMNQAAAAGPIASDPGGGGAMGGMTGIEMAQLGLLLGSELFKGQPGPRPPSLPSSSFSPMRPVFRG